ncbi:hypothetical protein G7062_08120 [Erysipelothrix sp. HDW6C]|uniref:hypothetical protein n=1 Tax=Erysipelothrix sp. HDW6C TaxID=2714930 RepID=UPI00140E5394|nr:hypothetical protein [Erysipelothrix sp. HDW6C]QIK70256.1 hypothetical protein G7062_08120 [Erysipelothrix sp. HDW6C]
MRKSIFKYVSLTLCLFLITTSLRVFADTETEVPSEAIQETNIEDTESVTDEDHSEAVTKNTEHETESAPVEKEQEPIGVMGSSGGAITPFQASIHVEATSDTLEVGQVAEYRIFFTLPGSADSYKNVRLILNLPNALNDTSIRFDQNLKELEVRGIVPIYDAVNHTLTYDFNEIEGGFESSITLKILTENGYPLNGEALTLEAKVTGDNLLDVESSATTTLVANYNASLSNKFNGILDEDGVLVARESIRYLDTAQYGIGLSVNRYTAGSLALQANSDLKISYTLPEGLQYISDTSGVTPVVNGKTYTWTFPANTNQSEEYYVSINFTLDVKVDGDFVNFSYVNNEAVASITFVDGHTQSFTAIAKTMVSPNYEFTPPPLIGETALTSVFSGPKDGLGGLGWIANDDPSVYDGANLGWRFYLTSIGATNPEYGLNSYDVFFMPDENINITRMYSGDFVSRAANEYPMAPLEPGQSVQYSISIKYVGEDTWTQGLDSVAVSRFYTAEELGIDPSRKVEVLWMHFHDNEEAIFVDNVEYTTWQNILPGITSTNLRFYTSVDEGYIGSIESKSAMAYAGWDSEGYLVTGQSDNVPADVRASSYREIGAGVESRLSPKTAQVIRAPEGKSRYVRSNISLANTTSNLIKSGSNTLRMDIINDISSIKRIGGPLTSYALIGEGIVLNDVSAATGGTVSVLDTNYQGSGKTLIKLEYTVDSLHPNSYTRIEIPVTVSENAPFKIDLQLIGYLAEDFEVADTSNANGTFTLKKEDTYHFNGNEPSNDFVYVTDNSYTYTSAYEYFASANIKGLPSIEVYENGSATMTLSVHNNKTNPMKSLVLIGVLPTREDTFVLNDDARQSKFDMNLTGPIVLPEAYANAFDVYYSTSKEPLVNGILDANIGSIQNGIPPLSLVDDQTWLNENEVSDFASIRSYKIVMKTGSASILESVISFEVPLQVDQTNLTGLESIDNRIAYASYAVAVNEASPLEAQAVQFIYTKTPRYDVSGNNVTMNLRDAQTAVTSNTFMDNLTLNVGAIAHKDGVLVPEATIALELQGDMNKLEVGVYTVNLSYSDGTRRSILAENTVTLTIIDETKPSPTLPSTGIAQNVLPFYFVGLGIAILGYNVLSTKYRKRD